MKHTTFYRVIILALPILGMSIGGGWAAEGLSALIQQLNHTTKLLFGSLLFFLCALWAYQKGREYLPIRTLERSRNPKPHPVIILPVSQKNFRWDQETNRVHSRRPPEKSQQLTGNLEQDTQKGELHWNWQQLLRAIHPHHARLRHIHLLGSPQSHQQLEECKQLLKHYLDPTCHIEIHPRPIDFEDLDALRKGLDEIINHLSRNHREQDILLDSTGGTKTTSIAIALYTSHRPKLRFQYVNNDGEILTFNVLSIRESELG